MAAVKSKQLSWQSQLGERWEEHSRPGIALSPCSLCIKRADHSGDLRCPWVFETDATSEYAVGQRLADVHAPFLGSLHRAPKSRILHFKASAKKPGTFWVCSWLSLEREGNSELFGEGYVVMDKAISSASEACRPWARAIFNDELTGASSSCNTPDLIAEPKGPFTQAAFSIS